MGDATVLTMPQIDYALIEYIDFAYDLCSAKTGDEGYLVLPTMLCYFNMKQDGEHIESKHHLPLYGLKTKDRCYAAVITGFSFEQSLVAGVKNEHYYIYPRFSIRGSLPYEEICIHLYPLTKADANYSGMGRVYRKYLLENNICTRIKDRMNPYLDYAKDSVYIRIRQGWKPVPSKVLHQTIQNEPPMHVACTFERVGKLLDKLKEKGVEKAEICLVGWNSKGHDGRWPQPFPVEEALGGEEALRKLIQKAQTMGYQITCHSNSSDGYEISDMWKEEDCAITYEQKKRVGGNWSGGEMYFLCPYAVERNTKKTLPLIADLGFKGLHYIDVVGTVNLIDCYSEEHFANKREAQKINLEVAKLSKKLFGGFASEGGYDHLCSQLDYALYVTFSDDLTKKPDVEIADRYIPLWQIVYHGIVLSNPCCGTVNAWIKGKEKELQLWEYGGRPTFYYYSKFVDEDEGRVNWMGDVDFTCDNEEDMEETAALIGQAYKQYMTISHLQTECIHSHEKLEEQVFCTTYCDGTKIYTDYNALQMKVQNPTMER